MANNLSQLIAPSNRFSRLVPTASSDPVVDSPVPFGRRESLVPNPKSFAKSDTIPIVGVERTTNHEKSQPVSSRPE
jgi:hypothetical protein